jgi:hypothetical protein
MSCSLEVAMAIVVVAFDSEAEEEEEEEVFYANKKNLFVAVEEEEEEEEEEAADKNLRLAIYSNLKNRNQMICGDAREYELEL